MHHHTHLIFVCVYMYFNIRMVLVGVTSGFVLMSTKVTLEVTLNLGKGQEHRRRLTDVQSRLCWAPA